MIRNIRDGIDDSPDIEELQAFFAAIWGLDSPASRRETIFWRYRKFETSVGNIGRNIVWRSQGRIVGHIGFLPVLLEVHGRIVNAAWLLDWVVLPSHRGSIGGMKVLQEAVKRTPIVAAIGLSESAKTIFRRTGWVEGRKVNRWQLILDAKPYLERVIGRFSAVPYVSKAASLVTTASWRIVGKQPTKCTISVSDQLPVDVLGIIRKNQNIHDIRVKRDAKYLSNRYGQNTPWEMRHITVYEDSRPSGWSVWSVKKDNNGQRVGNLLDQFTDSSRRGLGRILFTAGLDMMVKIGVTRVSAVQSGTSYGKLLGQFGFLPSGAVDLMWRWNEKDIAVPSGLYNKNSWYISGGDSDIDR